MIVAITHEGLGQCGREGIRGENQNAIARFGDAAGAGDAAVERDGMAVGVENTGFLEDDGLAGGAACG